MRERKRYVFRIQLIYLGYVIYYKSPSKNSHIALKLHMYPNIHIKSKKLIWVQATGFNSTCFSFLITLLSLRSFNEHKASSNKLLMWTMVYQYAYVLKIAIFVISYFYKAIFVKHVVFNGLNFLCLPSHIERREDTWIWNMGAHVSTIQYDIAYPRSHPIFV